MKKERFREEQIVRILKEAETGRMPIVEICRKYGISEFTFYRWRRKYQGLSISEARRLRELEKENQRLKRLLAQRDLEIDAIQEVLRKNF
jgi:putative transposase